MPNCVVSAGVSRFPGVDAAGWRDRSREQGGACSHSKSGVDELALPLKLVGVDELALLPVKVGVGLMSLLPPFLGSWRLMSLLSLQAARRQVRDGGRRACSPTGPEGSRAGYLEVDELALPPSRAAAS